MVLLTAPPPLAATHNTHNGQVVMHSDNEPTMKLPCCRLAACCGSGGYCCCCCSKLIEARQVTRAAAASCQCPLVGGTQLLLLLLLLGTRTVTPGCPYCCCCCCQSIPPHRWHPSLLVSPIAADLNTRSHSPRGTVARPFFRLSQLLLLLLLLQLRLPVGAPLVVAPSCCYCCLIANLGTYSSPVDWTGLLLLLRTRPATAGCPYCCCCCQSVPLFEVAPSC